MMSSIHPSTGPSVCPSVRPYCSVETALSRHQTQWRREIRRLLWWWWQWWWWWWWWSGSRNGKKWTGLAYHFEIKLWETRTLSSDPFFKLVLLCFSLRDYPSRHISKASWSSGFSTNGRHKWDIPKERNRADGVLCDPCQPPSSILRGCCVSSRASSLLDDPCFLLPA